MNFSPSPRQAAAARIGSSVSGGRDIPSMNMLFPPVCFLGINIAERESLVNAGKNSHFALDLKAPDA